jgi:hypothetical protein
MAGFTSKTARFDYRVDECGMLEAAALLLCQTLDGMTVGTAHRT